MNTDKNSVGADKFVKNLMSKIISKNGWYQFGYGLQCMSLYTYYKDGKKIGRIYTIVGISTYKTIGAYVYEGKTAKCNFDCNTVEEAKIWVEEKVANEY